MDFSSGRKKFFSFGLIFLGLLLILFGYFYSHLNIAPAKSLPSPLVSPSASPQIESVPQTIQIPKINLQSPIIFGGVEGDNWVLSDKEVMYLPSSGKLGEGFNTVLYAHKRVGLFIDLNKLSVGDQIIVSDKNGKQFNYLVYEKEVIKPVEVAKIQSNVVNNLTLFTCDGVFDQSRLVVRAKQ